MKVFLVIAALLLSSVSFASDISFTEQTQLDMMNFCSKDQIPSGVEAYIPPHSGFSAYIISIKSTFIDLYLKGGKSFEYRKSFPCEPVTHVIFYDSESKNMVATGKVVQTIKGNPNAVIDATWTRSGVSKMDLWWYYQSSSVAFATEVKFKMLARPMPLSEVKELEPSFTAPQGYSYLKKFPKLEAEIKKQLSL